MTGVQTYALPILVSGNSTYTAGMEIQAKDPTTMISLRGSNYNDTQEGKLMKSLALADKELDLDGDGINETFVIPFSAKAQSGDVREYLILATLDDMTVFVGRGGEVVVGDDRGQAVLVAGAQHVAVVLDGDGGELC